MTQHGQMALEQGATLVPFVVETFGAIGIKAQAFSRELATFASTQPTSAGKHRILSGLTASIAIAIQRGNASIVLHGAQLSRAAAVVPERHPLPPPVPAVRGSQATVGLGASRRRDSGDGGDEL